MPIRISCPKCHEPLKVPDYAAAQPIKCPHCGSLSQVPDVRPVRQRPPTKTVSSPHQERRFRKPPPLGDVAMALGLASIVTCCVPVISGVFALMAIVLGSVATARGHQLPAARAGVKLGILGFFLMLLFGFVLAELIMDLLP